MPSLNRGDLIWIARYDPQGKELAGRHPAVVISPTEYNVKQKMAIICQIKTRLSRNLFEVPIPEGNGIDGVVIIDSLLTIDTDARSYSLAGKLPSKTMTEVLQRIRTLLT
jgi:mRNA interferase MazF